MTIRFSSENLAAFDDAVFEIIRDAASQRAVTPAKRDICLMLHCRNDKGGGSIARLADQGRIQIRDSRTGISYLVPGVGETVPPKRGRPPSRAAWSQKADGSLTDTQAEALRAARKLAAKGSEICAVNVAAICGISTEAAIARLNRIAGNGHLRPIGRARWALVDRAALPMPKSEPKIEVREIEVGGVRQKVRCTVYPPMLAHNALQFGCGLGRGSVALAGEGAQRVGGRHG